MTVKHCDRCGAAIDASYPNISLIKKRRLYEIADYDLCDDCVSDFHTWMRAKGLDESSAWVVCKKMFYGTERG
jgi:hypothetical protein